MSRLRTIAEELDVLLLKTRPASTASSATLPPQTSPGAPAESARAITTEELVRSTWDYVAARVAEHTEPAVIGEAFMLGCAAAAQDFGREPGELGQAGIKFLESILASAKATS